MIRYGIMLIIILALLALAGELLAFGLSTPRLGKLGYMATKKKTVVVPACPSPTAPNGVFDLSLCSNSSYIIIFPL